MHKVSPSVAETGGARSLPPRPESPLELNQLYGLLSQAYSMINGMLERVRESQGVLQDTAVQKLHDTNTRLNEVTSATESAATHIMDGLDRALVLLDRLESGERSEALTPELREELFGVMNHLQFQDILAQQLQHASSLLHEMESQLLDFAEVFDPALHGARPEAPLPRSPALPASFDPRATFGAAEERQALADELLGR